MELWMHLGGLLSTQEARVDSKASFVLSNLPHAPITPRLHAPHLPFFVKYSHVNVTQLQSNPVNTETEGVKESVIIHRASIKAGHAIKVTNTM